MWAVVELKLLQPQPYSFQTAAILFKCITLSTINFRKEILQILVIQF